MAGGPPPAGPAPGSSLGSLTRGLLDSSRSAVRAVQARARHMVSQNKRRFQEGGFDLDLSYITETIIAMGFPAGDISSGVFGYVEARIPAASLNCESVLQGFYRNHMEEVLRFLETRHKGHYKVYNLCSERLYDASLFEGTVASFPFDDHNCPPLPLILSFCKSAYSWQREDMENIVVVHCKAGMARTGLMVCCLLLYTKFLPTAEEAVSFYNNKRCIDGKALVLPSQLRYVKYFEKVLRDEVGEITAFRKCILRGIRLHKCPYWVRPSITISDHNGVLFSSRKHARTRDLMPEDIWHKAPRKGVVVFALPGERCVADLEGDFRIFFHDRHGDFYCWLNTSLCASRQMLPTSELDWFDKRKLPSPGFQVEVVLLDSSAASPPTTPALQTMPAQSASVKAAARSAAPSGGIAPSGMAGFFAWTNRANVTPKDGAQPLDQQDSTTKGLGQGPGPAAGVGEVEKPVLQQEARRREEAEDNIFSDSEDEEAGVATAKAAEQADDREPKAEEAAAASEEAMGLTASTSSAAAGAQPAPPVAAGKFGTSFASAFSQVGSLGGGLTKAMDSLRLGMGQTVTGKGSSRPTSPAPPAAAKLEDLADPSGSASQVATSEEALSASQAAASSTEEPSSKQISSSQQPPIAETEEATASGAPAVSTSQQVKAASPTVLEPSPSNARSLQSDFKALAAASSADASVFTFGDEDESDSEEE
eukprot:SM000138S00022  [mRNA]  locus=s138:63067:67659:- [translate_table: standard]